MKKTMSENQMLEEMRWRFSKEYGAQFDASNPEFQRRQEAEAERNVARRRARDEARRKRAEEALRSGMDEMNRSMRERGHPYMTNPYFRHK